MNKAYIETSGDRSVGIFGDFITVDFGFDVRLIYEETREETRDKLRDFFSQYTDGTPSVRFDDECPNCGVVYDEGVCANKNCIGNAPDGDD